MLDPLTAISLSSAVVSFVDFGSKVVSGTRDIYKSGKGTLQENDEIEIITTEVTRLNDRILSCRPSLPSSLPNDLSQNDESLRELAASCKIIADDLLDILQELKVRGSADRNRKWSSFRKAVASQTPWNKDKVQSLEKRLQRIHEQISRRLMVLMRWVSVLDQRKVV